ncbi:MAG: penicillin-binding protein 1C [Flavobacteriales bacterium]|nr:penicillin-binding protein 1C [Flavobacteriales bacterium]
MDRSDRLKKRIKISLLITLGCLLLYWAFCLPDDLFDSPTSTVVFDKDDYLLGARIAPDGQWRFPLADSVPFKFEAAILAYEDERFYKHWGVSVKAIARAVKQNISRGEVVSGASTITMQLMRMAGNRGERTYFKKIKEIFQATRAEVEFSKEEILNLYASNAPFGGNVVGLDAASWRYYQKPAFQLTWAEACALAVLPNAPGLIFPGRGIEDYQQKRDFLLKKLLKKKIIDKSTYEISLLEPLPDAPLKLPQEAFHLTSLADRKSNGEIVKTTVNRHLQARINHLLDKRMVSLNENQIQNAAVLVVQNSTGDVIAYVGNSNGSWNGSERANDMIRAARSSGSILKPFLYAQMLNLGMITPHELIPDIPTQYGDFAPKNFDETFSGAVKANEALSRSLNIPAVRMLHNYGVEFFYQDLQKWGFTTVNRGAEDYGLSLILGGAEISLWDLVNAYRTLALNCTDGEFSQIEYERETEKAPADNPINAASAWSTIKALEEVIRPEERSAWKAFGSSQKIAWKTGTSYGFRDAWAVGMNADYTIGVWVGNANGEGRPGLTGLNAAAPILFDIFNSFPAAKSFVEPVSDLSYESICSHSGMRANRNCSKTETREIPTSCSKNETCHFCKKVFLDAQGDHQVTAQCCPADSIVTESRFTLPPLQEWFYMKMNPSYQKIPPYSSDCFSSNENGKIKLIYPSPNSTVFLPREYDGEKERIVFKAVCDDPNSTLFWHLDESFQGSTSGIHHLEFDIDKGKHDITIWDEAGSDYSTTIVVD